MAQLQELVESEDVTEDTKTWVRDVLIRRLSDDSAAVLLAVLNLPCLVPLIPPAALFDQLHRLLRATAVIPKVGASPK